MKAILLATGEHDTLAPLTRDEPSPMLPIANRPVIAFNVELMSRHRFNDIIMCVMHQPDRIEAYCETGRRWNVDFTYLVQRKAVGSAGAIARARGLINETFLVMPADRLVDADLTALLRFHRGHRGIATALLVPRTEDCGDARAVRLDAQQRICSLPCDADAADALSLTGVFIFEPEIFEYIPYQTVFDLEQDLLPALLAEGIAVHGHALAKSWNPLSTFARYQAAQEDFLHSLNDSVAVESESVPLGHPYVEAGNNGAGIWRAPNVIIHPTAQLRGPLLLGAGCQVGRDVTIGPNTVVGSNCIIDDGASIEHSTVLPNTYIGKLVKVERKLVKTSTLIDIASETTVEVPDRLLLAPAGTYAANALLRNNIERLIAAGMLLVTLPLLLVAIWLTWMEGTGPVFTRVVRVGRSPRSEHSPESVNSLRLSLLRVRTRTADGGYTNIGHWLELWGIHRLPELINVVSGDLALVGVKPLSEQELNAISEEWHRRRFDCPAGFTGRWYTEFNQCSDLEELFVVDAYQAAVQSMRDSLNQVAKTPLVWWRRRKTMLHDERQTSAPSLGRARLASYVDDQPLKQQGLK